ncbi:DUF6175 family protein [Desulfurobacterium atlanticum]|uniref:Uncharacterized protein n=1 Tax=Desulfurobacterium atlanticum TaxID=240169 RepID=A0A238YWY7_9BACT|nr:DUF6175 family protein [Desulfurobacterium atlanticum]SNR75635.1 hypothetical protein SAMN06265340_10574 [Desulfurobacterium atlanticum]
MRKFILFSLLGLIVTSCASSGGQKQVCTIPSSVEPLSREAQFVESTSTAEYVILASGKGCNVSQAKQDAKKAAIWFVLYAGDRPLLQTSKEKRRAKGVVAEILSNPDRYIRWSSAPKSKRKEGPYVVMSYLFKVDVASIKNTLLDAGVIASTEEISEEVGLPFIAVLPESDDEFSKFAVTVIEEYLQDRDYEVYVPEDETQVSNIIKTVAALEGKTDPYYMEALQVGSDIFVKVKTNVWKVNKYGRTFLKASAKAKAYETATGKLLGASTGFSPERNVTSPEAVVQEATNDLADKITRQIRKAWIKEAKKGKPFKVVVFSNESEFRNVDKALYRLFRKLSKRPVKRLAAGKSAATYVVYVKGVPNAYELFLTLEESYSGPGKIEKVLDTGSLLIIKAGSSTEDIVIE